MNKLLSIKNFMAQNMHEPLNLAEIHEAIGIVCSQLFVIHKSLREHSDFMQNIKASIEIRKIHYG